MVMIALTLVGGVMALFAVAVLGLAAIPLSIMWIDNARMKRKKKAEYDDATYRVVTE